MQSVLLPALWFPFCFRKPCAICSRRMQQQMRDQQRQEKREGEVTIERNSNQNNRQSQAGDYVDFEEVD
jgi:hypothetical protein